MTVRRKTIPEITRAIGVESAKYTLQQEGTTMLALKDYPTFRQWIQVVAAAVLGALVSYHLIDSSVAAAVVAFIAAVLPNALAVLNTPSTLRTWLFTAIGALQVLLISLDLFTEAQITPIVNIVFAVVGVSVAVTHTPTPLAAQDQP